MAVTADKPAPYAPASAVLDIIDRFRNRGLQSPINADVLGRAGVSPSLQPRTLQTLVTLDLIDDDGVPTDTFQDLRRAPEDEFQERARDWLRRAYAEVFGFVDPSQDDETRIRDAFRNYQPFGQQSRMVTLFVGLSRAVGLMPEAPSTSRSHDARPRRPQRAQGTRPATRVRTTPRRVTAAGPVVGDVSSLPPALAGLLTRLPTDVGWSKEKRDRFVEAFEAALDYCVPIIEKADPKMKNGDQ